MHSVLDILLFTGFIQGIIVGFLLIFHNKFNKKVFTILGYFTIIMSLDCLSQNELLVVNYPWVYWINNGNLFLFGPLFYLFVKSVKSSINPSKLIFILHLTPFFIIKLGDSRFGANKYWGSDFTTYVFSIFKWVFNNSWYCLCWNVLGRSGKNSKIK